MPFCSKCGAEVTENVEFCEKCEDSLQSESLANAGVESPFFYYVKCLKNYVNFKGRAIRKEFWWFAFFNFVVGMAIFFIGFFIDIALGNRDGGIIGISLSYIYYLATFLPYLAVTIRRLHDVGHSGLFFFVFFIPFLGAIIGLYYLCKAGDPEENKYGESEVTN